MRRLKVGILDLVTNEVPMRSAYGRVMNPNLSNIMPQMVAVWCEQAGHAVTFVCYTGFEDLLAELPTDLDIIFVGAFTQAAQLSYALSNILRQRGIVTVLGGPHARCYPEDACQYFDYVLGLTDRSAVQDVLSECEPHRPMGRMISASQQPLELPSLQERWKFVEATLSKAPWIKIVPMLGSLGCPYTCSFCIDSTVDYQPLGFDQLREDLSFLVSKVRHPIVGWYDPNFGIRFNDYMEAIEAAAPAGRIRHLAESSLSLLSEPHLQRLKKNGFKAILPGIESWFDMGDKSKTRQRGEEKLREISDHVNMILRYIPYLQANFVLGLDTDEGAEPFELTKRFVDLCPGAFPGYSLNTAFGRAAPLNLQYQRDGRVLPFPFHVINNNQSMNIRPKNYAWTEFYDRVVNLTEYSFSWRAIARRFASTRTRIPKWMNLLRGVSSEGFGRIRYHTGIRRMLDHDSTVRDFFEGNSVCLPEFYTDLIRRDLGPTYAELPAGALMHDPNAYLKAESGSAAGMPVTLFAPRMASDVDRIIAPQAIA